MKGHATAEDIAEGKATAVDKAGNDVADSLVREATALHGKGTVDLAYWLEGRHKAYCEIMGEIQLFIIQMFTLDKEERDRRRREANPFDRIVIPKVLLPTKLHYSTDAGIRRLDIKDLPTILHRFSGQQKALTYVHRFLRIISIRPTLEDEPGVTWLELLIAFELHGGKLELALPERAAADMARPLSTTRQLLFLFKSLFRFVLDTCANVLDAKLFNTSHTNGTRLRTLAVQHALPSVNCMPIWDNSVVFLVTQAAIRQKGKMTRAMVKSHAEGCLEIPWSGISMKGVPAWRATIAQGPTHILQTNIAQHTSYDNHLPHLHISDCDFIFRVPNVLHQGALKVAVSSFAPVGDTYFARHAA